MLVSENVPTDFFTKRNVWVSQCSMLAFSIIPNKSSTELILVVNKNEQL